MRKKNKSKEGKEADEVTEFSDYVPSSFDLPLLDDLFGDDDKHEIILADVKFKTSSFGMFVVITLADGSEYRTSSKVMVEKLQTAIDEKIPLPIKALLLRKGSGNNIYFDIV